MHKILLEKPEFYAEFHIAQANYARWKEGVTQREIDEFVLRADEIYQNAHEAPGFVWRYDGKMCSPTIDELFGFNRVLLNMSVWESIDELKHFVVHGAHLDAMKSDPIWVEEDLNVSSVLWWVATGTTPSISEAKNKLDSLKSHGATQAAFTFNRRFQPL